MFKVTIENVSVRKGDPIPVRVVSDKGGNYGQLQMEVYEAGVRNPRHKLGFGRKPKRISRNTFEVTIDSQKLDVGLYEIKLVRFHDPKESGNPPQLDFRPEEDYSRKVFEVISPNGSTRGQQEILNDVQKREARLEQSFIAPVDVRDSTDAPKEYYSVYTFVKDVLVSRKVKLQGLELLPTGTGLDRLDHLRFVNSFLDSQTKANIEFAYEDNLRNTVRQNNPVCVVHFPYIVASSPEKAKEYSVKRTNLLLEALSILRDAGGEVFDIVVNDLQTADAVNYTVKSSYVGNLSTGHLSGEKPSRLEGYIKGLEASPTNRFLTKLFKQARREETPDFQYVRLWQILELMADNQNYDKHSELLDFEGNPMKGNNGEVMHVKGSVKCVFNLLRENEIGSTQQTWKDVNIWFAFRCAVAHFGSVSRVKDLRRKTREWGKIGLEEMQDGGEFDRFLWKLKEDVKLLLMRSLVANQ